MAKISPTANALLMAGGDPAGLAKNREALALMLRAIREGYEVLKAQGIPITPSSHRVFQWIPERLLQSLARHQLTSEEAAIKIGHARQAQAEMKLLADEFQTLAKATSVPTPAIDRLYEYIRADTESGASADVVGAAGRV